MMKKWVLSALLLFTSGYVAAQDIEFKADAVDLEVFEHRNNDVGSGLVYFSRIGFVINEKTPVPSCLRSKPTRIFGRALVGDSALVMRINAFVSQQGAPQSKDYLPIYTARVDCSADIPLRLIAIEMDSRQRDAVLNEFDLVPFN